MANYTYGLVYFHGQLNNNLIQILEPQIDHVEAKEKHSQNKMKSRLINFMF